MNRNEFLLRCLAGHRSMWAMNAVLRVFLISIFSLALARGAGPIVLQPQDPAIESAAYFPIPVLGSVAEFSAIVRAGGETHQGKMKLTTEKEQEEIQGHKYFKQVMEMPDFEGLEHIVSFVRHESDGIHSVDEEKKDAPEYINVPFPLSVGKEWTYVTPNNGQTVHSKAEAIEDVQIGEQSYKNCLKISDTTAADDGPKMVITVWYAPKVGEVKITLKVVNVLDIEFLLSKPAAPAR